MGLANGIVTDRAAVEGALTMPWSTRVVEGHIHRVTLIERQGYGRGGMTLLTSLGMSRLGTCCSRLPRSDDDQEAVSLTR